MQIQVKLTEMCIIRSRKPIKRQRCGDSKVQPQFFFLRVKILNNRLLPLVSPLPPSCILFLPEDNWFSTMACSCERFSVSACCRFSEARHSSAPLVHVEQHTLTVRMYVFFGVTHWLSPGLILNPCLHPQPPPSWPQEQSQVFFFFLWWEGGAQLFWLPCLENISRRINHIYQNIYGPLRTEPSLSLSFDMSGYIAGSQLKEQL